MKVTGPGLLFTVSLSGLFSSTFFPVCEKSEQDKDNATDDAKYKVVFRLGHYIDCTEETQCYQRYITQENTQGQQET